MWLKLQQSLRGLLSQASCTLAGPEQGAALLGDRLWSLGESPKEDQGGSGPQRLPRGCTEVRVNVVQFNKQHEQHHVGPRHQVCQWARNTGPACSACVCGLALVCPAPVGSSWSATQEHRGPLGAGDHCALVFYLPHQSPSPTGFRATRTTRLVLKKLPLHFTANPLTPLIKSMVAQIVLNIFWGIIYFNHHYPMNI